MQLETLLANIPQHADLVDHHGATHLPIYNTATYDLKRQTTSDKIYDYSRTDNPTRNALETIFAKAEQGSGCVCTNTGIAAISLLFETVLKSGDAVLVEKDCYGGTYRLLQVLFEKNNIRTFYADFTDEAAVESILKASVIRLVLCESPTNPGLKIIDLKSIARLVKQYGSLFAVDNSMATFASQRPLVLGADFSLFSATKFISGHGSVVAGAIVAKSPDWAERLHYFSNAQGRAQSPQDVFLVSLGLPTLVYRMKTQEQSAIQLAEYFQTIPEVVGVKFPGLSSHPQFELAQEQMKIIPSIVTIELENEFLAEALIKNTKLFGEKVSFGTADSRLEIPARMSHATYSEEDLKKIGLSKATVRISVGLENVEDLIEDVSQALKIETLSCI